MRERLEDERILRLMSDPRDARVFMIGIKGTGMAALAEALSTKGASISGSDVSDVFYTDAVLKAAGIREIYPFGSGALASGDYDIVIHSAAFSPENNSDMVLAIQRGFPVVDYTQALGALSAGLDSSAVAGVHGKTTTTAIAGTIARELALPVTVILGSAVASFGGKASLVMGDRMLIAETCEYRQHFMDFRPRRMIVTSVESDHQDYFPTYESMRDAFVLFGKILPPGGEFIYCADDAGASEVVDILVREGSRARFVPYGRKASGDYALLEYGTGEGVARFRIAGFDTVFELRVPGEHVALDALAALALCRCLVPDMAADSFSESAGRAIASFKGTKRRSEIVADVAGILILDDYAHHPTAIRETIRGLKAFYPGRRLVVDFMPHTYSRTKALLEDFARAFDLADSVILHGIYASARETEDPGINGRMLFELVRKRVPRVLYEEKSDDALASALDELSPGDIFVTMGAGDNWRLGIAVRDSLAGGGVG